MSSSATNSALNSLLKLHEFIAHATEVRCLTVGPSHNLVATGGADCKINIWEVQSGNNLRTLGSNKSAVECLSSAPSEQCIVSGSASGSIKVFDLHEGRYRNLGAHKTGVTSVQYHPFSDFVASGSRDTSVKVWDVRNKECVSTYSGHEQEVTCVRFSPEGDWIASAGKDGLILIFDMVAGKHLQSLRLSPTYATTFEFHPLERILGAATSARSVRLWDLDTMAPICATPPEASAVRSLGFLTGSYAGCAEMPYLCSATKDHVKMWSWGDRGSSNGSMDLRGAMSLGPEGAAVSSMVLDGATGKLTGGAYISNFASIYQSNVGELIDAHARTQAQALSVADTKADSKPLERPPFQLYGGGSPNNPAPADHKDHASGVKSHSSGRSDSRSAVGALPHRAESKAQLQDPVLAFAARPSHARGAKGVAASSAASAGRYPSYEDLARENGAASPVTSVAPVVLAAARNQSPAPVQPSGSSGYDAFAHAGVSALPHRKHADAEPKPRGASAAAAAGLFAPLHVVDEKSAAVSAPRSPTFSPPQSKDIFRDRDGDERRDSPRLKPSPVLSRIDAALDRKDAVQELSHRLPPRRYPDSEPASSAGPSSVLPVNVTVVAPGATVESAAAIAPSRSTPAVSDPNSALLLDAMRGSKDFAALLSQRLIAIRTLRKMWQRGDLEDVIDYLCTLEEAAKHDSMQLVVLADFFHSVELRGNGLCLDSCVRLLPLLDAVLATSTHSRTLHGSGTIAPASEHILRAVLKALLCLLGSFGELIRSTCAAANPAAHAGVDLQRDARLSKCKTCSQAVVHLRQRLANMTLQFRANRQLTSEAEAFLVLAKGF